MSEARGSLAPSDRDCSAAREKIKQEIVLSAILNRPLSHVTELSSLNSAESLDGFDGYFDQYKFRVEQDLVVNPEFDQVRLGILRRCVDLMIYVLDVEKKRDQDRETKKELLLAIEANKTKIQEQGRVLEELGKKKWQLQKRLLTLQDRILAILVLIQWTNKECSMLKQELRLLKKEKELVLIRSLDLLLASKPACRNAKSENVAHDDSQNLDQSYSDIFEISDTATCCTVHSKLVGLNYTTRLLHILQECDSAPFYPTASPLHNLSNPSCSTLPPRYDVFNSQDLPPVLSCGTVKVSSSTTLPIPCSSTSSQGYPLTSPHKPSPRWFSRGHLENKIKVFFKSTAKPKRRQDKQ